jgi:hypothetical protein
MNFVVKTSSHFFFLFFFYPISPALKKNQKMGGKEIVTLQFGAAANYVGAHFWNLQVLATFCGDFFPACMASALAFEFFICVFAPRLRRKQKKKKKKKKKVFFFELVSTDSFCSISSLLFSHAPVHNTTLPMIFQDEGEFVERADGSAPVFDRTRLFAPEGGAAFPRVISVGARGPGGYRAGRYDGLRAPPSSNFFLFFVFLFFFCCCCCRITDVYGKTVKFCMLNTNMPRLG